MGASRALRLLLVAALVALTALGAVVVHPDLPVTRRLAGRLASSALTRALSGTVEVAPLSKLAWDRVQVPAVTVRDAEGREVLVLEDVKVVLSLPGLLRSVLFGSGPLLVIAEHARVEHARVTLLPSLGSPAPSLARALEPRRTSGGGGGGRPARVLLQTVECGAADAEVRLPDLPVLSIGVQQVRGWVQSDERGVAVDVERFGAVVSGPTGPPARGSGTLRLRAPGGLRGTFEGFVGDVELKATALVEDRHVDLELVAPGATPSALGALIPGWPLREPVALSLHAKGTIPEVDLTAGLALGPARLSASGRVNLGATSTGALALRVDGLDARALLASAPPGTVAGGGKVTATVAGDAVRTVLDFRTAPTVLGGVPVPAFSLQAQTDPEGLRGTARLEEPGLPLVVDLHLDPAGAVTFDARSDAVDLAGLRREGLPVLAGRGSLRARGTLRDGVVTADLQGDLAGVAASGVSARRSTVRGRLAGPIREPRSLAGELELRVADARWGALSATTARVAARGSARRANVDAAVALADGPSLEARGELLLEGPPELRGVDVAVRRDPVVLTGKVARLDPSKGSLTVRDLALRGAGGELHGELRVEPELFELKATGSDVDLDAIATAFALPRGTVGGRLHLDASVESGRDVTRARVRASLGEGTLLTVGGLSLRVSLHLDRQQLRGEASGLLAGVGALGATLEGQLGEPRLSLESLRSATGRAEVQVNDLDLSRPGALLAAATPLAALSGRASARLVVERGAGSGLLPHLALAATTRELRVRLDGPGPLGSGGTELEGYALSGTADLDGATGAAQVNLLVDEPRGELLSLTARLAPELAALLEDPLGELARLRSRPLEARVSFPERPLSALPAPLSVEGVDGAVRGVLALRGTLERPTVTATLDAAGLRALGGRGARPVDVHVDLEGEPVARSVEGRVLARAEGREVADLRGRARFPAGGEAPEVNLVAELRGVPLDLIPGAQAIRAAGSLEGRAAYARQGSGGSVSADLSLRDFALADEALGSAALRVWSAGNRAGLRLALEGGGGRVDAEGAATLDWSSPLPDLALRPIRGRLVASRYPAATLAPFVRGVLARLGGRLDADLTVALDPASEPGGAAGWSGGANGTFAVEDGSALVDLLGLEVRGLRASGRAEGAGRHTRIRLTEFAGRVRSPRENLRGAADLELEGLTPRTGTLRLVTEDVPVLFRGAPQGRVTGRAEARLTRLPDRMRVGVDLTSVTLRLPQSSSREVIDLAELPDVLVVQRAEAPPPTAEVLPWELAVHLGKVAIRRRDIDVSVTGDPVLLIGDGLQANGLVELTPGGRIPVLGKVFVVDQGRAVFDTGDATNPRVEATAGYLAPSGTRVLVDVRGTLKAPRIDLRSDPPLPEPEVFALLLGGTGTETATSPDPAAGEGGTAAGAVALGSGVGALGLNQLLGESPVELRVESTSESRPRYTAAVRVKENLWFEASTYQQSTAGAGATSQSVFSGTMDYRFTRRWSLRSEVGTSGGALDLLWQYRY